MLAYTGRGEVTFEPVDLNDIVRELAQLMRSSIDKSALLRTDLASHLPLIAGDRPSGRYRVSDLVTEMTR